jgi:hypothetical protein
VAFKYSGVYFWVGVFDLVLEISFCRRLVMIAIMVVIIIGIRVVGCSGITVISLSAVVYGISFKFGSRSFTSSRCRVFGPFVDFDLNVIVARVPLPLTPGVSCLRREQNAIKRP